MISCNLHCTESLAISLDLARVFIFFDSHAQAFVIQQLLSEGARSCYSNFKDSFSKVFKRNEIKDRSGEWILAHCLEEVLTEQNEVKACSFIKESVLKY